MNKKTKAALLIVGMAVILGIVLRTANRADAASQDCFSDSQGPSTPTICS